MCHSLVDLIAHWIENFKSSLLNDRPSKPCWLQKCGTIDKNSPRHALECFPFSHSFLIYFKHACLDVETQRPILSNKFGGLSGTPIKPIALRCVFEISSQYDIPIIGCGGISTWEDAVEFFLAGASAVQLGSAIGDNWIGVFDDINKGILQYMERKGYSSIKEIVGLAKKS